MSEQSTPGPDDQRLAELIGPAVEESGLVLEHVALKPAGTGLVLQVLVTPVANEGSRIAGPGARQRMPGDALLVSVKTRKSQ